MKKNLYALALEQVAEHLAQARDWAASENFDYAVKYQYQAEAVIELLEVNNCGSVGGFDRGQTDEQRRTLDARLAWLVKVGGLL